MNIYIKWGLVVAFNSIFSLVFAADYMKTITGALGVIGGILCFIFLYTKLDLFLLRSGRKEWRKGVLIATIVTGLFSLHPALPLMSGALALEITGSIFNFPSSGFHHKDFFPIFITTLFTGVFLSILVVVFASLLRLFFFIRNPNGQTV